MEPTVEPTDNTKDAELRLRATESFLFTQKKNIEEVTFNVFLHCNDCVKKAQSVVPAAIKGIKDFKVSLEEQTFWIQYDATKNTKENIIAVLAKKGYEVKEVAKGKEKHTHHDSCCDHDHSKDEKHTTEHKHEHK